MRRVFLGLAITSAFTLAACSSHVENKDEFMEQANQTALTAYVWHLERVSQPKSGQAAAAANQSSADEGQSLPAAPAEMRPFDISFNDDRVSVEGLCNNLSGSYTVNGERINISQMMSTRKMCSDDAVMALENYVGQVLPAAEQWQLQGVDTAQLAQSTPTLELRFANGMRWQLEGTATAQTKYGQEPVTEFLQVDPQVQTCTDGSGECLKVRQLEYDDRGIRTETGPWQQIQRDQLEGYELDPNYSSIIRVKRFMESVADGENRPVYVHDMTVETQAIE
ncbi:MAG TPA: META domain-containing protein [Paenalcaligenes sp.]|nr:META domain-containing protein [Paenalcaligenes sp.]